jgi:hypothetical protein
MDQHYRPEIEEDRGLDGQCQLLRCLSVLQTASQRVLWNGSLEALDKSAKVENGIQRRHKDGISRHLVNH